MGTWSIWHWVIVLVVVLLVFGTKKIRNIGSDLGGAVRGFKDGMKDATGAKPADGATPQVSGVTIDAEARKEWWAVVNEWKAKHPLQPKFADDVIMPQHLMAEINRLSGGEAIVTSDVGQHQMWAAQLIKFHHPRLWLNSGGLGSMGFGLPSAIGAQFARPDKLVFAICGDGGFQMSIPELATIANQSLPVKIIVMNNGYLGMVRQWQDLFYEGRYASSYLDTTPDFVKLADAYGAVGLRADKVANLDEVLKQALATEGPVIVDVPTYPYENCYPMIPAGGCNHEMILEDPPELKKKQSGAQKVTPEDKDTVLTA